MDFFKLFVPLEQSLHDLLCDEEALFEVFAAQVGHIALEVLVVADKWLVGRETIAHGRSKHRVSCVVCTAVESVGSTGID